MKKILCLILILFSLSAHAASMTGTIEVRLIIRPSPCIATAIGKEVTIDCGNIKNKVNTVVTKQPLPNTAVENYLITVTY